MYRYRKIFKLTKVFSGVSAGVEEQAAPLRVATEVRGLHHSTPQKLPLRSVLAFACFHIHDT
jgi:hypothetical protein